MKRRNRAISLLLATAMTLSMVLSGCGNSASDGGQNAGGAKSAQPDTAASAEAPAPADGTEAAWDTGKEDTIILSVINNFYTAGEKKLAEEYMKLHPETKVVVDVISDNDAYLTKMVTSLSDDKKENAPDIVHGNFVGMALTNNSMDLAVDKGYLYDMTEMLDEENPYNGNAKVADVFETDDLTRVLSNSGGKYRPYLPFDKIGFAFFYNKNIFEEHNIQVPETYEEVVEVCQKLKDAGYDVPLSAGYESFRLGNTLADAIYRAKEEEFLIQPEDALWDETTMASNKDFKFDEAQSNCDQFCVLSPERMLKYGIENGVDTPENKAMWTEFQKLGQYFPKNWIAAESTQCIADFESQISPMLYQASFNAGLILSDINQLSGDMAFDWATFQINSFANPPEGFQKDLRSYWDFGNIMSIIYKEDSDHMARVKDFYKFWYSPQGAQLCYEETLTNGNYVQGPCVIKGVTLSEELEGILAGFEPVAPSKEWNSITGLERSNQADIPKFNDAVIRYTNKEIDVDGLLKELNPIYSNYNQDAKTAGGYDLDPATDDTPKE